MMFSFLHIGKIFEGTKGKNKHHNGLNKKSTFNFPQAFGTPVHILLYEAKILTNISCCELI